MQNDCLKLLLFALFLLFLLLSLSQFPLILFLSIQSLQLFAGTEDNPLAFCNDPSKDNKNDCVGEFYISVRVSREFLYLQNETKEYFMLVPRVWYVYAH